METADIVLVAAERRLIERAVQFILLVDSSKFRGASGSVVCALDDVDVVISDSGLAMEHSQILSEAGVELIVA